MRHSAAGLSERRKRLIVEGIEKWRNASYLIFDLRLTAIASFNDRTAVAPYPVELAFRLISMFSFVGDTVLDPFCGTGTTIEAAIRAHRSSIGYEIEPQYLELSKSRFSQTQLDAPVVCVEPKPSRNVTEIPEVGELAIQQV